MSNLFRLLFVSMLAGALVGLACLFAALDAGPAYDQRFWLLLVRNSWVVLLLLVTPALVLFILQHPGAGPDDRWRSFWTVAWLTWVLNRWWARFALPADQFDDRLGPLAWLELVAGVAWALDIVLSYTINPTILRVRLWRGTFHLVLLLVLTWITVFRGQGVVRGAGFVMVSAVLIAVALRIALRRVAHDTVSGRLFLASFRGVNRLIRWDAFPTWLAVTNLGALREDLRARNLHDTASIAVTNPNAIAPVPPLDPTYLTEREPDGHHNDLAKPTMGRASMNVAAPADSMHFDSSHPGARFGRNFPLEDSYPDMVHLLEPNPRDISNRLLALRKFLPAESLNLLAAAWIQFQTHDWFNHGEPVLGNEIEVPLPSGDAWHESPMRVRRTRPDPTRAYEAEQAQGAAPAQRDYVSGTAPPGPLPPPPTYVNSESHWWDASQVYGSDRSLTRRLRTGADGNLLPDGKLALVDGRLGRDPNELDAALSGFTGNWWVGLSLLHTLFVKEHNAICDRLRRDYSAWPGDRIFAVARMVNGALMAKIHTVEWTPAILAHPALQVAMNANWWGLMSERLHRLVGRVGETEAFAGIPGSGVDHHGADFCLTEEFVAVYRLHPLMPDELRVLSCATGQLLQTFTFPEGVLGPEGTLRVFDQGHSAGDVLYSFGRAHPGATTIHNFPNYLRQLLRPDGEVLDLAAIDIVRDRERGVPRYNRFRRLLRLPPITSFDDFRNPLHPNLGAELRAVYGQDADGRDRVELLDLMVGMFAEVPPAGFGLSDTAFRIFILMASRRLKSDRFIAAEFNADVYTPAGFAWVNDNSMTSVLLRHHPELRPALRGVDNAFKPWSSVERGDCANPAGVGRGPR